MEGKYGKRYFSGVHGWESFFIAIISIAQQWHNHEDENRLKDLLISAKMKTTRKMSYNEKFSAFMCMFFYCLHSSSAFSPPSILGSIDFVSPTFICSLQLRHNENKLFFSPRIDCQSLIELFDFRLFIGLDTCSLYWIQMETWEGNKT